MTTTHHDTTTHGRAERAGMFNHMCFVPDRRSPEEQQEAQRKERARRTGRGRKDWWKQQP